MFPKEGVSFTNCHNNSFIQNGGTFSWKDGCQMRIGHRDPASYSYNMRFYVDDPLPSFWAAPGAVIGSLDNKQVSFGGDLLVNTGPIAAVCAFTGAADQHFRTTRSGTLFYNSGSSVSGGAVISKTGGRLICDTPLRARNLTINAGSTIAFAITNATDEVSARGEAGWNEPVLQVARDLTLPASGEVAFEALNEVKRASPKLWNVIGYVNNPSNLDLDRLAASVPNTRHPKVLQETSEKLLYLKYKPVSGIVIMLK